MPPSAIAVTPPEGLKTSELTAAAVAKKIAVQSTLQPLDASKLKFTRTTTPMTGAYSSKQILIIFTCIMCCDTFGSHNEPHADSKKSPNQATQSLQLPLSVPTIWLLLFGKLPLDGRPQN